MEQIALAESGAAWNKRAMPTTEDKSVRVMLAKRGSLSTSAVRILKDNGIHVVFEAEAGSLREIHPATFSELSSRAKAAAFDYALSPAPSTGIHSDDNLLKYYIDQLKKMGGF